MEESSLSAPLIVTFTFGVIFIITILVIAIKFPKPTDFQYMVFRIVLAIAGAGAATPIPGLLDVQFGNYITASGAIAVFIVIYFFSPANLVSQHNEDTIVEKLNRYWHGVPFPEDVPDVVDSSKAYNALTLTSYLWNNSSKTNKNIIYKEIWDTACKPWFDALAGSDLQAPDGKAYKTHIKTVESSYKELEQWTI